MRGAALLDSDFGHAEFPGKRLRSDQRRISFAERNDRLGPKFRKHDFLLGPDPALPPQSS